MSLYSQVPHFARWIMLFSLLQPWNAIYSQNRIDSLIHLLEANYQQEKIYLCRDKAEYISGESIFLKGFVFAGYQLSDISSNLFVEILDKQKNLIAKSVSPVFKGITETVVRLPDTISTGVYYLRAYTKWMLNFDERFQYAQPIVIYNPKTDVSFTPDLTKWDFRAVPEGEKLLDGVPAKLAIRFFDLERPTIVAKIKLFDRTENTVVEGFSPLDQNVAVCRFTPLFGHTYEAEVTDSFGMTRKQVLPQVVQSGVVLNVLQNDTSIDYLISSVRQPDVRSFRLVGTIDNIIVYKASIKMSGDVFSRSVSTKEFPAGVLRLSLFDDAYNLQAERLCFVYPKAPGTPNVRTIKKNLRARGENEVSIEADSSAILFVTAFDDEDGRVTSLPDIVSSFWLTSDFVREIKDAGQYFNDVSRDKKQALDGIMISEKWERFDWQKVLSGSFPKVIYQDDGYLAFSGQAEYKDKPFPGAKISFIVHYPDSTKQVLLVETDDDGKFVLRDLIFEESASIDYFLQDKKVDRIYFTIRFSPGLQWYPYKMMLPKNNLVAIKKDVRFEARLLNEINTLRNDAALNKRVKELEEVVVWTKTKSATQALNEKLSSGRFYNSRETIYDFVNKEQMTTATSVLQFVSARVLCDNYHPCSYFVDEFPVTRQDLSQILINDVAMIKIQGKLNAHIILVYLKTGGEFVGVNRNSGKNTISVAGYEKAENVRLNYSMPEYRNAISKDSRVVLLWSDLLVSDGQTENTRVIFFNNDFSKRIRVSVMGIDGNGEPFSLRESY